MSSHSFDQVEILRFLLYSFFLSGCIVCVVVESSAAIFSLHFSAVYFSYMEAIEMISASFSACINVLFLLEYLSFGMGKCIML